MVFVSVLNVHFPTFPYCLNVAMMLFSVVRHCCREFFTDGINRLKRRRVASSSPYCQVELDWRGPSGQRWTSSASGKDQVPCPVENLAIAALQAAPGVVPQGRCGRKSVLQTTRFHPPRKKNENRLLMVIKQRRNSAQVCHGFLQKKKGPCRLE